MKAHQEKVKAVILYGAVAPDAPADEQDVLEEVGGIAGVLTRPGFSQVAVPVTLDLKKAAATVLKHKPTFVFNLVESIEGSGRFIHMVPSLLDFLGVPYTGAPTEGMFLTSNKLIAKEVMAANGLPTIPWATETMIHKGEVPFETPCLLKSSWEHASIGIKDDSFITRREDLVPLLDKRADGTGRGLYLEPYVEGREFNVAMLGGDNGVEVLPVSEILFTNYPAGKPRLVDYRAKWVEDSFEYENTPRTFEFEGDDLKLVDDLKRISLDCWRVFGLRGYARVDFRIDMAGNPLIMEINANPCINPESGFIYTSQEIGLDYAGIIERIIQDSIPGFKYS
jgi:D-alanine-D-alanine ligase